LHDYSDKKENEIFPVELRGIGKLYPGSKKKANNNINLSIRKGEILCIAGENGAGKTTLMKILGGLEKPDEGEILINGNVVTVDSPTTAWKLGIGMVHQNLMIFTEYTAAENIVMGMEKRKWGFFYDSAKAKSEAKKIIEENHFSVEPGKTAGNLSIGEMQQVEICRLLYRNADIIILDEPTSSLTGQETAALFKTLKKLAAAGKSIFLITHKLREIKQIAGRAAILCSGELAGIYKTNEINEYELAKLIAGAGNDTFNISKNIDKKYIEDNANNPVIVFDKVTVLRRGQKQPLLDNVSFSVRPGEIAGFTGTNGNGLGVLEAVLGGFLHPVSGKITHYNQSGKAQDISRLNIRRLRKAGLAYVPADRERVGSAPAASTDENMIINRIDEFSAIGILSRKAVREYSDGLTKRYNIIIPGKNSRAASLSGGNLQKLILAREIDRFYRNKFCNYIVFSEPTRGLDASAGDFTWKEICSLREKGAAIILISGNIDEILSLADKIIVMYRGKAIAQFFNNDKDNEELLIEKIGSSMQGLIYNGK